MNQPPQTDKRIVSRGAYVRLLIKRMTLGIQGFAAAFGMVISTSCAAFGYWRQIPGWPIGVIILFGCCVWCFFVACTCLEKATVKVDVVPLTRANTVDLPAQDSLVRASAEPVEERQAVLLRAATEDVERHKEQLVRAAGEQEPL